MQVILEEIEYKRLKAIEEFMDSQDKCYVRKVSYYGSGSSYYVSSKSDIINEYTKSIEDTNESLRNKIYELRNQVSKIESKKWYQKIFK